MPFTQANRLLSLESSALTEDLLLLDSFTCTERISGLFQIQARCLVELTKLRQFQAGTLIGANLNIRMKVRETQERIWHGMVRRISMTSRDQVFAHFVLDIVPDMWRLTQITDCRIYQNKNVPDIVDNLLRDLGIMNFRFDLQKSYTNWDYCVQYRESYFQFISRMLEQEGIFYFFEHQRDQHVLVIADHPNAHPPCPIDADIRFMPEAGGAFDSDDLVAQFEAGFELRAARFTLRDHHFQMPAKTLQVSEFTLSPMGNNSRLEVFDYPGEYAQMFVQPDERLDEVVAEGEKAVDRRMESEEMFIRNISGSGVAITLAAGFRFNLTRHFVNALNDSYVLTSISHQAAQTPGYLDNQPVPTPYRNSFRCIPHDVPYRPQRLTPKPVAQGIQTAVVVGPPGEEIHTDKFGRVKVRFFWDRRAQNVDTDSAWVRVGTPWAGNHWGMVHIPRVGQEVIVDFVEGDPDHPMVIGSAYNTDQMPPYTLPDHKTQSGIKSRSSKNGTAQHFNEIRFEDLKGKEQIYVHAENSLTTVVEGSESRTVGGSRTSTIHKDDKRTVQEGDYTLTIEKKDRKVTIKEGNDSEAVDKGNVEIKVTLGNMSTEVPAGTYKVKAKEIMLEATDKITIKCGGSSIELTPANIKQVATMIDLNP
ncbi:MAG: type VI secretion system tip protein TssI/VgrG [Bryobacteraceae bacterium]